MIVEIVVEHFRDSLHARLWRQTHTMRKGQCSMHGCTGLLLAVEMLNTCYALAPHTPLQGLATRRHSLLHVSQNPCHPVSCCAVQQHNTVRGTV